MSTIRSKQHRLDTKERPLFVPLRREYFEAFEAGKKTEEYRRPGGPWNARTCAPGRPVVLSCGYGKSRRLAGHVAAFSVRPLAALPKSAQDAVTALYGDIPSVACIKIALR